MNRVVRDGQVAVIYSPGFGAGWYSWHDIEDLIFDPSIVAWIESSELDKIDAYVTLKYPDAYLGGIDNLAVAWVPEGSQFRIDEYDGSESVEIKDAMSWITA